MTKPAPNVSASSLSGKPSAEPSKTLTKKKASSTKSIWKKMSPLPQTMHPPAARPGYLPSHSHGTRHPTFPNKSPRRARRIWWISPAARRALEKLRRNDDRTRDMTVAEYATWSEYRHASLTYRKAKRFREWCGLGVIAENKPSDDVMDILGFLTSEMVQNLTAQALRVQKQEALLLLGKGTAVAGEERGLVAGLGGLFAEPEGLRKAVDVRHVRMAFQQLQGRPKKSRALLNRTRLSQPSTLRLVSIAPCPGWVDG
ncbi:hypothetical protein BDP81DRAFT_501809, partial [Colletotrichum phormii]